MGFEGASSSLEESSLSLEESLGDSLWTCVMSTHGWGWGTTGYGGRGKIEELMSGHAELLAVGAAVWGVLPPSNSLAAMSMLPARPKTAQLTPSYLPGENFAIVSSKMQNKIVRGTHPPRQWSHLQSRRLGSSKDV